MGFAMGQWILTMVGFQLAKCPGMVIFMGLGVTAETENYGIQEKTGTWKANQAL